MRLCNIVVNQSNQSRLLQPFDEFMVVLQGAVHKVRHARGGRGSEKVWQFVTGGGGKEHVTSRLYKFLSYIWNMKFKVMFNFLL